MKLFSLFLVMMLFSVSSCSSQKWHAVSFRDPASEDKVATSYHRLETSWGEVIIKIGEADRENKTPVTLEIINLNEDELKYKRDYFNFLSFDQTKINIMNEFEDKTLISEDDQSFWSALENKTIPVKPLQTRTIAGEANIKKGYFIRDTIYIDAKDLIRHDRLSVVVSNELIKTKEHMSLEFTASK